MQVNVTFRHLDPSDSLKAFAREKVERVKKYLDHASEANVILSIEKHVHHAEVLVHAGPFFLRGKEQSDDMYASIAMAMDKVERQLKRYKGRLRALRTSGPRPDEALRVRQHLIEAEGPAQEESPETTPASARVVETKELVAQRMTVDEAVLQLNIAATDFLVFTNAETNQIAVLYRRQGETSYGLIDARPAA